MSKNYIVRIARNETTVYEVEVTANSEYDAEKNAYKKFAKGDYVSEEVVYGEEETYEIEESEDFCEEDRKIMAIKQINREAQNV